MCAQEHVGLKNMKQTLLPGFCHLTDILLYFNYYYACTTLYIPIYSNLSLLCTPQKND